MLPTMNQSYAAENSPCVIPQTSVQEPAGIDPLEKLSADVCIEPVRWLSNVSSDPHRGIHTPLPKHTQRTKRLVDIIGASIGIIVLLPVMLLTAIAVKISSPGEAIFSQTRVGLNRRRGSRSDRRSTTRKVHFSDRRSRIERRRQIGYGRLFTLYKFRTMVVDAEKNGAQFASENDPRVTRLGKFMRLTRLDELPQLWNVLRGDMSLVGPRPERPEFIEELSREVPNYLDRLQLKPGVTGVAQIVNGYDNNIDSFKRKIAYDLLYLRNCCLLNDLKILLRTVLVVLTGKGAM
jgi:lipopolysaccharide/colanic/teichoic acid biosynthesis glycosyltransferase